MTTKLPEEAQATEIPDDAGAVGTSADGDVVGVGGAHARDCFCVSEQRHLQVQRALRAPLAILPHINHLSDKK